MTRESILVVDDDRDIVSLIEDILEDEGFRVQKAYTGDSALKRIKEEEFDLILLDVMLPDIDGFELCKKVRNSINVPILFITARNKTTDKVFGLELGGDDYITKPFEDNELVARVKAHLRREKRGNKKKQEDEIITYKGIQLNKNSFEVIVKGEKAELSTREFQILCYMMENANTVLTREKIYDSVWGYEEFGDINTVTVHIKKLREKIDKNGEFIKTVWGAGYKFIGDKV